MADEKKPSNIKAIKDYFGMSASEAMAESKQLTPEDKAQLGQGILEGTLTY